MKTIKQIIGIIVLFFLLLAPQHMEAQFWKKVAKTAEKAAEKTVLKKTEEKVSKKTGKTIDDTVDGKPKKKKSKKKKKKKAVISSDTDEEHEIEGGESKLPSFAAYSKFDFVAGENILAFEDFSQDEIGDLPARWNSSNSAEVVTLNNEEGRFIEIGTGTGSYVPEWVYDKFPITLHFGIIV